MKLLLECSDEDYQVAMLVSISKLASRSTILVSEHVCNLICEVPTVEQVRMMIAIPYNT